MICTTCFLRPSTEQKSRNNLILSGVLEYATINYIVNSSHSDLITHSDPASTKVTARARDSYPLLTVGRCWKATPLTITVPVDTVQLEGGYCYFLP